MHPLAATSTAEDSSSPADRNKRVALTFSLQGGKNDKERLEIVWRLLFGLGVLPACIVCYYRFTAEETEAFKATQECVLYVLPNLLWADERVARL
ncbi:hypothetical protein PybrP1_001463 [[Pythium] brassicae (nom. inval.)]|nr:hypothetical protein PybrP1_001463 [[Pythium] brassicae (nom. inval.)]